VSVLAREGEQGLTSLARDADEAASVTKAADEAADAAKAADEASSTVKAADEAADTAKAADEAADAAKGVDEATDAAKTADQAGNTAKGADEAADVSKGVDEATDAVKTADQAGNTSKGAGEAADVGKGVDEATDAAKTTNDVTDASRGVEEVNDTTKIAGETPDIRSGPEEKYLSGPGGAGYVNEAMADKEAIEAYQKIVAMEGDTSKIASHYDLPEDVVAFVKQHFFVKEHTVAAGPELWETGKFTPYSEWAELWNEAMEGVHDPSAIRKFLAHEYIEGKLMEAGFSYNSANPEYWARFGGYPSPTAYSFGAHDLSFSDRGFKHWLGIFKDRPEMIAVAQDLINNPLADDFSNIDLLVGIILKGVEKP
jgi:hypothetical protein